LPNSSGEWARTFSSARNLGAFLAQKPSESAVNITSATNASSRALPVSPMIVSSIRWRFAISQLRSSYMSAERSSNDSAAQAGNAPRARATISATWSADMSGTWPMVRPVAGLSTAIV
jgi:hypothetical protein